MHLLLAALSSIHPAQSCWLRLGFCPRPIYLSSSALLSQFVGKALAVVLDLPNISLKRE